MLSHRSVLLNAALKLAVGRARPPAQGRRARPAEHGADHRLRVGRVAGEEPVVVLQVRPASAGVGDDRVELLRRQ